jgi:hypothetical protein
MRLIQAMRSPALAGLRQSGCRDLNSGLGSSSPGSEGWPRRFVSGPTHRCPLGTRRILRVRATLAGSVSREPRGATVANVLTRRLHMEVDRPLTWDHVVEARVRADRVRVCRSAGADRINLFLRPRPGPRRPLNFTGESGTNAYTRDDDCAHRSRKQGLRAHVLSPFLSNELLLAPRKLVSRRHGVNRRDVGPKDDYTQQSRRALARFTSRWAHWSPRMRPAREQDEPARALPRNYPLEALSA